MNIGILGCAGRMGQMLVREVSATEGAVLAGWAKRCGAECAREWNGSVGKALGLQAPVN